MGRGLSGCPRLLPLDPRSSAAAPARPPGRQSNAAAAANEQVPGHGRAAPRLRVSRPATAAVALGRAVRFLSTNYMPGTGIQTKNLGPPRAGKNDPDVEAEAQRGLKLAWGHTAWTLQS